MFRILYRMIPHLQIGHWVVISPAVTTWETYQWMVQFHSSHHLSHNVFTKPSFPKIPTNLRSFVELLFFSQVSNPFIFPFCHSVSPHLVSFPPAMHLLNCSAVDICRWYFNADEDEGWDDYEEEEEEEVEENEDDIEEHGEEERIVGAQKEAMVGIDHSENVINTGKMPIQQQPALDLNECSICFDDIPPGQKIVIQGCQHVFCKDCMTEYCNFKTSDASCLYHHVQLVEREKKGIFRIHDLNTYGVKCPSHKCGHVMLEPELKQIISVVLLERFGRFSQLHAENLKKMKELRAENELKRQQMAKNTCPRCQATDSFSFRRGRMRCRKCGCPFCAKCRNPHGRGISCERYKEESRLGDRTVLCKKFGLQICPNCGFLTTRESGCQFLICRCGQKLCNLCGCPLDESKHFSHFYQRPFDNNCKGPSDASKLLR